MHRQASAGYARSGPVLCKSLGARPVDAAASDGGQFEYLRREMEIDLAVFKKVIEVLSGALDRRQREPQIKTGGTELRKRER